MPARPFTTMLLRSGLILGATATVLTVPGAWAQPVPADSAAKPDKTLRWLDPVAFAPDKVLPTPPAPGSIEERAEMAEILAFAKLTSEPRRALAQADGEDETPSAFNAVTGHDLMAMPATAHLLTEIAGETAAMADNAKRHFHRLRPYAINPALNRCGAGKAGGKGAQRSYPSGHATFAWSMAWVLGNLMPERQSVIFTRAGDYGYSRLICEVHFASDVEGGHILGVLVAQALLADPRLASDIAAARAELAKP